MLEITSRSDLLTWFTKQLLNADPKADIAEGIVHVFYGVFDHCLDEHGDLDIAPGEWEAYFSSVFATINDCPGQQRCSRLIPVFLAAIYGDANAIGHVSGRRLIKLMMELLELGNADLKIERAGGRKCLVSTQRFERQHGVSVRVKLGRKKEFTEL
jgi:hypothetical protein